MSYPYGRPGGPGSGDPRGVGASGGQWVPVPGSGGPGSGGQRGVGVPGGQWVPVPGSGGPGSGGRRSSAGVVVGCVVGLVVAALVVGVAFLVVRSRGVEPGSNTTATARATEEQTITSDHYWADVLGGEFHIESTSVVQGPTDQDGAATLLVTLTMTNNTNNPEYALDHIPTLTQKGVIFDLANFSADQNMKVLTGDDVTTVEPGETVSVVAAYKYVYVGEPVVFVTDLSPDEHALDFPEIVVQPS